MTTRMVSSMVTVAVTRYTGSQIVLECYSEKCNATVTSLVPVNCMVTTTMSILISQCFNPSQYCNLI